MRYFILSRKNVSSFSHHFFGQPILHYSFEQELQQNTEIIAVQFIPDTQTLCLATLDGDIFTFDPNSKKSDCVGTIESGITSMSWSPDFEVVIFTNGNGNMLLMTQEWDVVNELPLIPNQQNEQQTSSRISLFLFLFLFLFRSIHSSICCFSDET
jgi:WD40 repeat protein